jgi:predicted dehydrogenase
VRLVKRPTKRRYRVALLGLGVMGQRHARVLRTLENRFELTGAYDPHASAVTPAGVERLGSEADAIAGAEVVLAATPIETHGATVAKALAAGRHVFVEKPVCTTSSEARVASAAARSGARLFVGHSERFNPVVRALAKLLRDETIVFLDLRRIGIPKPCVAGLLVNLGVHDFDLARYLGGGNVTIHAAIGFGGPGRNATPGPEAAHVLFGIEGGGSGHLHVRSAPNRERAIEVVTERWVYRGDLLAHRLERTARGSGAQGTRTDVPLPLEEPLLAQAVALADALDGAAHREIAVGDDGIRALELAERATADCESSHADVNPENLAADATRC